MGHIKGFFVLLLFALFISEIAKSQGCSDAGICTLNSIKDHSFKIQNKDEEDKNYFRSGITYSIGEFDISYTTAYFEYVNILSNKFSISGKLNYTFIDGELISTSNLGDLMLVGSYRVLERGLSSLLLIAGAKVPLNNSNIMQNDEPLPLHYQTSLGTYDLIVGLNYVYYNFGLSIALQQPVININDNEFKSPTDPMHKEFNYQTTNAYTRKSDLMNRISYQIYLFDHKFVIRPSILTIYHLANDSFLDENNIEQEISGSQGLTLNGNVFLEYTFSSSKKLEFSIGSPFITRDARPDGLTRKVVAGIEYSYSF